MKTLHTLTLAAVLAGSLLTAGCGSNSNDDHVSKGPAAAATLPAPGTPVPASAGSSVANFLSYLQSLNPNDETSEPSPIPSSFAVPDDESDNILLLT